MYNHLSSFGLVLDFTVFCLRLTWSGKFHGGSFNIAVRGLQVHPHQQSPNLCPYPSLHAQTHHILCKLPSPFQPACSSPDPFIRNWNFWLAPFFTLRGRTWLTVCLLVSQQSKRAFTLVQIFLLLLSSHQTPPILPATPCLLFLTVPNAHSRRLCVRPVLVQIYNYPDGYHRFWNYTYML